MYTMVLCTADAIFLSRNTHCNLQLLLIELACKTQQNNIMINYYASQILTYEDVDKAMFLLSTRSRPNLDFSYEAKHLIDRPEISDAVIRMIADCHYSAYVPLEINAELPNSYWRIVRILNHDALIGTTSLVVDRAEK